MIMASLKKMEIVLIALAILCLMVPALSEAEEIASGYCGGDYGGIKDENLKWSLSDTGVLTISGKGRMSDLFFYFTGSHAPWYDYQFQIKSVKIQNGVTSIGTGAFSDCENLTSVDISSTVIDIGDAAFRDCTSLTSVKIPFGVECIYSEAFSGCTRLASVRIPSSVESIGSFAFLGCTSLKNLTIPDSVISIGSRAFGYDYVFIGPMSWQYGYVLRSDMTITGEKGSVAQMYAEENGIDFVAIGATDLDIPAITSVTADGTKVTVTWGKVIGAEKYRLFYKKDGKWKKMKDTTGTSVTLNGTTGKTYTYTVRCINSTGTAYTSDYDKIGKSITLGQLTTPKIASVTADGTKVTVTWGKVTGAEKYRLFYKKDGKWTKLKDTTGTSVTLNGTTGKTYTYTVRCLSADGKSYTSAYDKTGKSITLGQLVTPKISSVTADGTKVTVKWGAVSGAEQYRLFYKKNGSWTKLKDTTGTSVTLNGTTGKIYTYTVRCLSADGKSYTSAYDKTGKSITLGLLATPKITSATSGADGIKLTWGKVTGAAKYRVFYLKDGKWTKLKDTTGTSVTITGGTKGKTYTYTVRCLSADGKTYTSSYDKNGKSVTK